MDPLDEYRIDPPPELPARGRNRRTPAFAVGAVVALLALLAAAYFFFWRRAEPSAPAQAIPSEAQPPGSAAPAPLGPAVEPIEVPPLDLADPLVRELLGRLSSRPEIAAWLTTDGLIRNFVTSVENVANGVTPVRHLKTLTPGSPFVTETRGSRLVIDRRSYDRYNGVADTVASLDPVALARIYTTLKPRLQEAYGELGRPDSDIDAAVERAVVRLLSTPLPDADVALSPGVVSYKFEDARYEGLSAAQKQLVRMGPRNARLVQRQLWALARELGIPAERLPPPPAATP